MYKIIQLHATDPEEVLRHAFAVMSDQEWERTVGAARLLDGYQLISLGTDDYIEIHDYSDWLARMDVKDITTEDAIALDRYLAPFCNLYARETFGQYQVVVRRWFGTCHAVRTRLKASQNQPAICTSSSR